MFLDKDGNADSDLSRYSHLATGVPGTVAGLAMALEKYGTIRLSEAMKPAIKLADDGFIVTQRFSNGLKDKEDMLKRWDSSAGYSTRKMVVIMSPAICLNRKISQQL
jgi:gamma-glutamyltranspeptidase/glutathione hydrolase